MTGNHNTLNVKHVNRDPDYFQAQVFVVFWGLGFVLFCFFHFYIKYLNQQRSQHHRLVYK